jgi:hypothetical protein
MESVVGVFPFRTEAESAAAALVGAGVDSRQINVLSPGAPSSDLAAVRTDEGEPPGMGAALGGAVGAAIGVGTVPLIGPVVASLLPGVGPVVAIGAAAAALIGATAGGVAVGRTLEHNLQNGLPKDELFFYEDALRQGRTVLIALARDEEQAGQARSVLEQAGAEDLDAARDRWWLGLTDADEARYDLPDRDSAVAESQFRRGFEAALHPDRRGRALAEVAPSLEHETDVDIDSYAFRFGYERGQSYYRRWRRDS